MQQLMNQRIGTVTTASQQSIISLRTTASNAGTL